MSEKELNHHLQSILKPYGYCRRLEPNLINVGLSDLLISLDVKFSDHSSVKLMDSLIREMLNSGVSKELANSLSQRLFDRFPSLRRRHILIESKYLPKWPVRSSTPIRWRRFTADQVAFLISHGFTGGGVYVALRVGDDDNYIYKYKCAPEIAGGLWTKDDFVQNAELHWVTRQAESSWWVESKLLPVLLEFCGDDE